MESTVVRVIDGIPTILRPGKITPEDIKDVVGKVQIDKHIFSKLEDGEKKTDIMVYFYRSYANKKIDLKVSNKCLGSQLNIYTCKNEGSGIRYNIYTSTENPHGDISVFKNYRTQFSIKAI